MLRDVSPPFTPTERLDDEFYYGYRTIITYDADGREVYSYQPLTPDDFLNPQEGDLFMQGTLHHEDTEALQSIFRHLYRANPTTVVFSDLKILWGVPGLAQPAPDVTVVPNVSDSSRPRPAFDVSQEGTRPCFILEVVSPRYRQPDRDKKVAIYEQARIEEYFIVDSWLEGPQVNYEILGYRLVGDIYSQIQPNEQGWVFSQVNNVWMGVDETQQHFFVIDGRTGEPILPAETRAQIEAEARAQAETRAQIEAEARAQAETHAQIEAEARAQAETRAQVEAEARAQAETRAQVEAQARNQAETRLAELELQLRELEAKYRNQ